MRDFILGYISILAVTGALLCVSRCASAEPLDLSRQDHQLHAVGSYAMAQTLTQILTKSGSRHPIFYSSIATLGIGLAKECTDSEFSTGDLKADLLGVAASSVFSFVITF